MTFNRDQRTAAFLTERLLAGPMRLLDHRIQAGIGQRRSTNAPRANRRQHMFDELNI